MKTDKDRIKHVTIESGHDPRLFSNTYAAPLKIYVGDILVYDSEAIAMKLHSLSHLALPPPKEEKK
jgi:hypothetical protein